MSSRVAKLFISSSGIGAPCRSRRWSTWRAITSRNVCPSFTSSSDFAFVIPMLVPSPPFSLSTTTRSSADGSASGRSSGARHLGERLELGLGQGALVALAQQPLVVRERVDRDLRQPLLPHLLGRRAHRRAMLERLGSAAVIATVTEDDLPDLLPLMRGYCDFYEVAPSDEALLAMSRVLIDDPERQGAPADRARRRRRARSASPRSSGPGRR